MWPEPFPAWWASVEPVLEQRLHDRLARYRSLTADGRTAREVRRVVRQARDATYARAFERRTIPGAFASRRAFRLWAIESAWMEAISLLPGVEFVRPWLGQLPVE